MRLRSLHKLPSFNFLRVLCCGILLSRLILAGPVLAEDPPPEAPPDFEETMIFNIEAPENRIVVDAGHDIGPVNRLIFGDSFLGHAEYHNNAFMDWGSGVWNPNLKQPVAEVMNLARDAGISALRFPGGDGVDSYDWKRTFWRDRSEFFFGIDEFMRVANELGAQPVITISYFTGNAQDAADMVEYLNSPFDGSNPNGGVAWAQQRAEKGHPQPYGVKYFELGNEVFNGNHNAQIQEPVSAENYANDYLTYQAALKAVDPNVKLGLVLDTQERNRTMFGIIGSQLDFMTAHSYPSPGVAPLVLEELDPRAIFLSTYARPVIMEEKFLDECRRILTEVIGPNQIPFVITEHNGEFLQNNPVPYRHALGTALLEADLLRIFMKPDHHVLMANHYHFSNEYWGMVQSATDYRTHDYSQPIYYKKRPTYFVYKLYHKNFGSTLIDAQVTFSTAYRLHQFLFVFLENLAKIFLQEPDQTYPPIENPEIPYLTVNASRDASGENIYLMIINRSPHANIPVKLDIRNFGPIQDGHAWILTGDNFDEKNFDAVNEENPYTVRLKHKQFAVSGPEFAYLLERRSLTSIVLSKNNRDDLKTNNGLDETYRLEAGDGTIYTYNPDGTVTIETQGFWRVRIMNTEFGAFIWGLDQNGNVYNANGDGTITAHRQDGSTVLYDKNFNIMSTTNAQGTTYIFNTDGTIQTTATDGVVRFYTASWTIASVRNPDGTEMFFDTSGNVIKVVDPQGNVFNFNPDGTIIAQMASGHIVNYTAAWRTVSIQDPDGRINYFNPDTGKVIRSVDPQGNVYVFNDDGTIRATMTDGRIIVFDSNWQVLSVTYPT